MPFDLAQWRAETRRIVADFAREPQGALKCAGVNSVYGFLLGSTMLPVVAAYAADPKTTIATLITVAGGLGANLIANLAQRTYDNSNIIEVTAQEAQSTELAPTYEELAKQLQVIPLAEQVLAQAGQTMILQQLRDELQHMGKSGQFAGATITQNQSGGINYGVGNTFGQIGDTVQGDKISGPTIHGAITSGRDTNIAREQTINNTDEASTLPLSLSASPALSLRLADVHGNSLDALTICIEARVQLVLDGDAATVPALNLTLTADGAGFTWPDGIQRTLALQPGIAPAHLPRWAIVAEQPGALTLRVLVAHGATLIQQLALTVASRTEPGEAILHGGTAAPAPFASTTPVGLALSAAAALPTQPNALTLVLDAEREGYRALLLDGGSAITCPLAITPHGLADVLAHARSELRDLVALRAPGLVYQQPELTIPQPVAEQTLLRLARLGARLWQELFSPPGSSADSVTLGERLRIRSQAAPLHITVAAAHLPFPWPLLYDRDLAQPITPDGFWGFRHVLATLPTSGRSGALPGDLTLGHEGSLRALIGLNERIDTQVGAQHALIAKQRQTLADLGLTSQEVTNEAALRDVVAAGVDADLVYLYCHIIGELPADEPRRFGLPGIAPGVGSTRIILTDERQALTLNDLQLAAPLSRAPLLRGGPLVVLNACGSAYLSPLTYAGLVPYLLDHGARTVIGTECETPIFFGAAFGAALLRAVIAERRSVGDALRATRRQFLVQHRNALGLLYALYGSADLRCASTVDIPE